jgi:hypothetical protein
MFDNEMAPLLARKASTITAAAGTTRKMTT